MTADQNKLNAAINFLKNDAGRLYFRDVVFAATSHKILPFSRRHIEVVKTIKSYLRSEFDDISDEVLKSYKGRANELGNFVQGLVEKRLNTHGLIFCQKPQTDLGRRQSSGYPDCLLVYDDIKIYADVKTYQTKTIDSSLRSFFYEPTINNKIQFDAPHLVIGFETQSLGGDNRSPFKLVDFTLVDLYDLMVNFKAEFNANNIDIYNLRIFN